MNSTKQLMFHSVHFLHCVQVESQVVKERDKGGPCYIPSLRSKHSISVAMSIVHVLYIG